MSLYSVAVFRVVVAGRYQSCVSIQLTLRNVDSTDPFAMSIQLTLSQCL